ncbi:MAG TPA: pentapeptide repeat-containing protein, partial [Candidatus Paceibacterota bacterium]|nr:pentapeptide repeat-containing protein [Candidatus Paceibacterota bacterium]
MKFVGQQCSVSNPLPVEETAALGAAVVRRVLSIGLIGLLLPTILLVWQNFLIRDQNKYLREQTSEIRRQIALDDEQSDWVRRKDLLQVIYDGRELGLSTRTRVEALKALVRLDNKLLDQGLLPGERVNLKAVDFSCELPGLPDCADLSSSWLVRVDFSGSDFRGVNLSSADLRHSSFVGADLSNADLVRAKLESTEFRETTSLATFSAALRSGNPQWLPEAEGLPTEKENLLRELTDVVAKSGLDWTRANTRGHEDFEKRRQNLVMAEFAIERIPLSDELEGYLNVVTEAAKHREAIFFSGPRDPSALDVDHYSRLPFGVMPEGAGVDIEAAIKIFEQLDVIERQAEEMFGRYAADI